MTTEVQLYEALEAYEALDDHIAKCEDCCAGAMPELCNEGFPLADEARLLMRAALARHRKCLVVPQSAGVDAARLAEAEWWFAMIKTIEWRVIEPRDVPFVGCERIDKLRSAVKARA